MKNDIYVVKLKKITDKWLISASYQPDLCLCYILRLDFRFPIGPNLVRWAAAQCDSVSRVEYP